MRPSKFQFERTAEIRRAVYRMARLSSRRTVIDIGCGDGAVGMEIAKRTGREVLALDIDPPGPVPRLLSTARADAHCLPLKSAVADAACFNFVLLWLKDPVGALKEAKRVLKPGGAVLILSEPDFGARVEDPDIGLGCGIADVIRAAGGTPEAGRMVGGWMKAAGFRPFLKNSYGDPVTIEDPAEIAEELKFLASRGVQLTPARSESIRIRLPLTYGWGQA